MLAVANDLPPRLERLRAELAEIIPCEPPTAELRRQLREMPLGDLLFIYTEWAQRLVRPAPRDVVIADAFWDRRAEQHRERIDALIGRILFGQDLTSFLSDRVHRHGYAPKGADGRKVRGLDWRRMDLALNAWGIHHLHLGTGGSEELVFVDFKREQAGLIMLGDHKSFHSGEVEDAVTRWRAETGQFELKGVLGLERENSAAERTALARAGVSTIANVDGKFVLSSMVSTSGASADGARRADDIRRTLRALDGKLDAGPLGDVLPVEHLLRLKGRRWSWRMHYGDLVLVEETTPAHFVMLRGAN